MYYFLINQVLLFILTCLPIFTLQQESEVFLITTGIERGNKSNWISYERVTGNAKNHFEFHQKILDYTEQINELLKKAFSTE